MTTIRTSIKNCSACFTALTFSAAFGYADTYSWTNFQSDIPVLPRMSIRI